MANWKTTVSGLIVAAAQGIKAAYPKYAGICDAVSAVAILALGYFAKDKP